MDTTQPQTEERLVALAGRLKQAMEFAEPSLPDAVRSALGAQLGSSKAGWGLALLLAGWQLSEPQEPSGRAVQTLLEQYGAGSAVSKLRRVGSMLPAEFGLFLRGSRDSGAAHKLAGAGAYLTAAVQNLGTFERGALVGWLRSAEFLQGVGPLARRFPPPPPETPAPKAVLPVAAPPPSRAQRFERLDTRPRGVTQLDGPGLAVGEPDPQDAGEERRPLPPPPPLDLDDRVVAESYLRWLGWSPGDIARFLQGPRGV